MSDGRGSDGVDSGSLLLGWFELLILLLSLLLSTGVDSTGAEESSFAELLRNTRVLVEDGGEEKFNKEDNGKAVSGELVIEWSVKFWGEVEGVGHPVGSKNLEMAVGEHKTFFSDLFWFAMSCCPVSW